MRQELADGTVDKSEGMDKLRELQEKVRVHDWEHADTREAWGRIDTG